MPWSFGVPHADNGKDTLNQYSGTATLDGGNGADTITNWNEPSTDSVTMSGGRGSDTFLNDDTRNHRDGRRPCAGHLHRRYDGRELRVLTQG